MKLTLSIQTFILNWSGIAASWGMNRTVAQIHALLLVSETPLTADEIKTMLQVARSNVSVSLRELQNWDLIEMVTVMGDRKKRFMAHRDMRGMFKRIMKERKKREVESALRSLGECKKAMKSDRADQKIQSQMAELTSIFQKLDSFYGKLIDDV